MKKSLQFLLFAWLTFLLIACGQDTDSKEDEVSITQFLKQHWPAILPPQGKPPSTYTAQESSLDPQVCGECHASQFKQWQASLHAHSMGYGIQWQLQLMSQEQGNKCLRCHAPLAEQKALVALKQGWTNSPKGAIPSWVPPRLANDGLVCASCHVRRHQRYGPPSGKKSTGLLPHAGFIDSQAFQDSRFCAPCHQHNEQDNPPRVNGKLLEDTLRQWLQSPQGKQGVHCQACHMPNRQHNWKGIHDADMTRQALDIQMQVQRSALNSVNVGVTILNRGAAHHLPTYMVAKINLIFMLKQRDTDIEYEFHRYVIGWKVNVNLTKEQFDTRIPAGDTRHLQLPLTLPESDAQWDVVLKVEVMPREHYERTFMHSLKKADKIPKQPLLSLRKALQEARASQYLLLKIKQPVPSWPIAK